ncbi:MAG TPA: biotin--[acetyl-CoA-carboxylase] ligase [Acidimicrobiales bacterium]|nr:biotin--[acetyl-CoA-carboxylase] ligase [Acidimicrobiales bacterium]
MSGGEWEIRWFEEIDSTNTYVRQQARLGAPAGLVAVADHQTAGRGRLGRSWESPPATNLLASVLLRPAIDAADLHLCTTAVALAAIDACDEVAGVSAQLKWPNDLLVGGAKVAGILAEAEFADDEVVAVVVGIGINVGWPGPPDAGGTSLEVASGSAVDRRALLDHLLDALTRRGAALDEVAGRRTLAEEGRRRSATIGQRVLVTLEDGEISGRAVAIDDSGRLVVETPGGPRTVTAGDVVHVRAG